MVHKKIFVLLLIGLLFVIGATSVIAQEVLPRISTVCESKNGQLFAVNDGFSLMKRCPKNFHRVVLVGEKGEKGDSGTILTQQSFYTKRFGPYDASPNTASTVIYGCDDEDVAIGGGMSHFQGNISTWRTIRSAPGETVNPHNWQTTIINEEGTTRSFWLDVKCLDLPKPTP